MSELKDFRQALVVGTARNSSQHISRDLLRIVSALDQIVPTSAFVVESDSSDATSNVLKSMAENDSRIRFASLGNIEPEISDRIARIRYCRNFYVKEIRNNPLYKNCDLIIVADLDGINTSISDMNFRKALTSDFEWDVLAANQSTRYYDILALRHPYWSPNNCLLEAEWLTPFMGKDMAWQHAVGDRMLRIPHNASPIAVDSAFGGLCIYKRWIFENFDYTEEVSNTTGECEHVTLHYKAKNSGAKIFIHPGLINAKWTEHSLSGSKRVRRVNRIANLFPINIFLPVFRLVTKLVVRSK